MSLDITGIGEGLTAIKGLADKIWPDRTEVDKAQLAAVLSQVQAQADIDKAEAQSTDPLQHWRGGLGWVCAFGYAYAFVLQPLLGALATLVGHPVTLPTLDISQLSALTVGMLGLGGLHVTERISGATK